MHPWCHRPLFDIVECVGVNRRRVCCSECLQSSLKQEQMGVSRLKVQFTQRWRRPIRHVQRFSHLHKGSWISSTVAVPDRKIYHHSFLPSLWQITRSSGRDTPSENCAVSLLTKCKFSFRAKSFKVGREIKERMCNQGRADKRFSPECVAGFSLCTNTLLERS